MNTATRRRFEEEATGRIHRRTFSGGALVGSRRGAMSFDESRGELARSERRGRTQPTVRRRPRPSIRLPSIGAGAQLCPRPAYRSQSPMSPVTIAHA